MWKIFKCWLMGHNWQQIGFRSRCHVEYAPDNPDNIISRYWTDHFLLMCTRCQKINEYHARESYNNIGVDAPIQCGNDSDDKNLGV